MKESQCLGEGPVSVSSERLVMVGGERGRKGTCAGGQPAEASWRKTVAMLRGGGVMLPSPRALHTKVLMAASSLSGLTACTSYHP